MENRLSLNYPLHRMAPSQRLGWLATSRSEGKSRRIVVCALSLGLLIGGSGSAHAHGDEAPLPEVSLPAMLNEPTPSVQISPPATPIMSPVLGGSWSPVYDWPLVAVHAALLPNGKVLSWDATPDDADDDPHTTDNSTTRVTLWDPANNSHIATNNDTDTDLFCAGSAHLWDGRILFAGGDAGKAGANAPLSNTNIYEPATNTWRRATNMNAPRWYSSVAALANGEMLTLGGSFEGQLVSEVFQFDQTWRALTNATPTSPGKWWLQVEPYGTSIAYDYQWIQATPEGSVISFGPQNLLASLDTEGQGLWRDGPPRDDVADRDYGSYAMFDIGKILVAGGGNSVATAVVIDTATQQTSDASPMNVGRRQHNLTILADGSVLVTGGNTDGSRYFSPEAGTKVTESWNPATGQFSVLNPMQGDRQYHSTALLLADGRVLSAGGGICGDCYRLGYEERNAEIFTPPYLYAGDASLAIRPGVSGVPDRADYAQVASLSVEASTAITRVHLIKLGSATHSENQDQRLVPLQFMQNGARIDITMPESRNIAPPGHYLLFLVEESGVPSMGSVVKLGQPLVKVGERITSTLQAGSLDSFAFSVSRGQWVLELVADAATGLYVTRNAPASSAELNNAVCRQDLGDELTRQCSVAVSQTGIWYVTLAGSQRSDYQLDSRLDALNTDNGQDSNTGSPTTRVTTGGSISPVFLLLILFFCIRPRRICTKGSRICVNG